jgi:hypothetical protein
MMKRFAVVLCALSCIYVFSSAAVDAAQWSKVYGSTGDESGAIWPIATGGYYLSGNTTSYPGGRNALFAKLNASGGVTSAKSIGGPAEDLFSVVNLSDGGFLVTGETKSFGTAPSKYNIVWAKFNASWVPVYQKVFGGAGDEMGGFEATSDGGLLFCGTSDSYGPAGDDDILIMKIDSAGNIVWKKVLHKGTTDSASQAIELSDGYVVSGRITDTPVSPLPGILVMKLNKATGLPLWTKLYTLPLLTGTLTGGVLHPLSSGSFILSGTMTPFGSTVAKTILVKISSAGAILWQKSYACATASVMASNVIENSDGTLIVSGTLMVPSTYNASILVMKLTASGALTTVKKRLGATTQYNMGSIMKSGTGELLLSGIHGTSLADAHKKVLYGKLDATTFAPLWAKTFGGTGMDIGGFLARSGGYMLEGITTSFGPGVPAKMNIFGMTLDANGNYPGCHVSSYTLSPTIPSITATSLSLTATNPTLTARTAGAAANITLTVSSVTLPATNICAPIASPDEPPLTEESETPGEQPEGE